MKRRKNILGMAAAIFLVLVMTAPAVTAYAATITIQDGNEKAEYQAYRLLDATTSDGSSGEKVIHYSYTLNESYNEILKTVTKKTNEKEIVQYISGLTETAAIRKFADDVYKEIQKAGIQADYSSKNRVFTNTDQGYYLIAEKNTDQKPDEYSLVMLDTLGQTNLTIDTKKSTLTSEKKVRETNDSKPQTTDWQDGADYDIGDLVPFQLNGTVSDYIDQYQTYYYAFHDQMEDGLTFDESSVVVKIGDQTVDASCYDIKTAEFKDDCTFEVVFTDLKQVESNGQPILQLAGQRVTVEFEARLNEKAVIGSGGNSNKFQLEFSNNPYDKNEKGKTPWDKVIVFTYQLTANKVDKNGEPLSGAGFTLYKWNGADKKYEIVKEINGSNTVKFEFKGVDAGTYKLVETTVPDGYNKAEDLIFIIEAVYDVAKAEPKFTSLAIKDENGKSISAGENSVFTVNVETGTAATSIVNHSGSELPSTGGIGQILVYVIGGIAVAGAGVLLIAKRRAGSQKK